MHCTKTHLFGLLPEDLVSEVKNLGILMTLAEARRVLAHILANGKADFLLKNPIKKSLQKILLEHFDFRPLKILERIEDPTDKSLRYLFESHDGALIEAVRIPLNKQDCFTICLSSQVGCAMACDFCATGRLGFKRNLEPWEIISQFWQVRNEAPGRVTGAVFMGQGEPFHNYENMIQAARVLSSPSGCCVDSKKITISTVGLVPFIRRYAEEKHPYRLIISLTSAIPQKRAQLLPLASRYSLPELADAIKVYIQKGNDLVTLAWVLIKGVNTGRDEVLALKDLMGDIPFKLNLIDVNDARSDGWKRADDLERDTFFNMLQELNVPIVRRYSVGSSRHSACGMLSGKRLYDIQI